MGWLSRLAGELSELTETNITIEALLAELRKFRKGHPDPILQRTYPSDMAHFEKGTLPQKATADFVLSFLDETYPGLVVPVAREIEAVRFPLPKAPSPSDLSIVLRRERVRRLGDKLSDDRSYWGLTRTRMIEKYVGDYALVRIDSHKNLVIELFTIAAREGDGIAYSIFWLCEGDLRVGDLLVNSFRFVGNSVCWSTDRPPEPVAIAFLRVGRRHLGNALMPLVMGGIVMGWMDDSTTSLFQSRIALIKLKVATGHRTRDDFVEFARSPELQECFDRLGRNKYVSDGLGSFLKHTEAHFNSEEARTAMGTISPLDVAVQ